MDGSGRGYFMKSTFKTSNQDSNYEDQEKRRSTTVGYLVKYQSLESVQDDHFQKNVCVQ